MLQDFFKLNEPFEPVEREGFEERLRANKRIQNVEYRADSLDRLKVEHASFENFSLSKTQVRQVTFKECQFVDCLFIGTRFESVEFHGCNFRECNFFKAELRNVYARPQQFKDAIRDVHYANVAVHLYQQLRENYSTEAQREYKNEAEYGFAKWSRKNNLIQARREKVPTSRWIIPQVTSWLYDFLFGYGYRLRNLFITTGTLLSAAFISNYYLAPKFFSAPPSPSVIKTIYFTITTMTTLGAAGYSPDTDFGYLCVTLNLLIGITILSSALTAMLKKLAR